MNGCLRAIRITDALPPNANAKYPPDGAAFRMSLTVPAVVGGVRHAQDSSRDSFGTDAGTGLTYSR